MGELAEKSLNTGELGAQLGNMPVTIRVVGMATVMVLPKVVTVVEPLMGMVEVTVWPVQLPCIVLELCMLEAGDDELEAELGEVELGARDELRISNELLLDELRGEVGMWEDELEGFGVVEELRMDELLVVLTDDELGVKLSCVLATDEVRMDDELDRLFVELTEDELVKDEELLDEKGVKDELGMVEL